MKVKRKARKNGRLMREDIAVDSDFFIVMNQGEPYISFYIHTWFDVDAYFGTHTRNNDDYVNFYVDFNMEGKSNSYYVIAHADGKNERVPWKLEKQEEKMLLLICEEIVLEEEYMTIAEFIQEFGETAVSPLMEKLS